MNSTDLEITQDPELIRQRMQKRTAILRIFNYYRTFLSFSLLLLFIQVPDQEFFGKFEPEVFQVTILSYIAFNIITSLLALIIKEEFVARTTVIFSVLVTDIIILTLLLYSSGGVGSGLDNFLIFPVAFAGVLIIGRVSLVIAAISVILTFYCEFNLVMRTGTADYDMFFQAGLLGAVLFSVNLLFQYVSRQLRRKEEEVTTLEKLNEMRRIAEATRHALEDSNARFEILLDCAGEGVLGLGLHGEITFANPKACSLLTIPRGELIGTNIREFTELRDTSVRQTVNEFYSYSVLHELQLMADRKNQSWIDGNGNSFYVEYSCQPTRSPEGELTGAVVLFQDVTERKQTEQRMHYLANYDALTDLVNRSYFQVSLEKAVARAKRGKHTIAVLLLDLDHFKPVNDNYGHDYGDAVLSEASKRLVSCIRKGDTAARLGGDEFAVMLLDFLSTNNLAIVAQNLIDEISRPYIVNGVELNISTSIGISVFENEDQTPDALLKAADTAMYEAKREGKGTYRFFHALMQEKAEEDQQIRDKLQGAIERNEFKIYYQPIVSLEDDTMRHCEALIRWKPPGSEVISSDVFIPVAEESGKIKEIGDWMLKSVVQQISAWREHLGIYPRVTFNISTRQLRSFHFREKLTRHLQDNEVPAQAIQLELSETGIMEEPEAVMNELLALHELGLSIAIDDFGTGYSSLGYLRRLPIDEVKVDKSFVKAMGAEDGGESDKDIVKVIIGVAHTMGLNVVAEGIETEEQARILKACGCDMAQGDLFSEPRDTLGVTQYMQEHKIHVLDAKDVPPASPQNIISLSPTPSSESSA